jgi:hypothetical protein
MAGGFCLTRFTEEHTVQCIRHWQVRSQPRVYFVHVIQVMAVTILGLKIGFRSSPFLFTHIASHEYRIPSVSLSVNR